MDELFWVKERDINFSKLYRETDKFRFVPLIEGIINLSISLEKFGSYSEVRGEAGGDREVGQQTQRTDKERIKGSDSGQRGCHNLLSRLSRLHVKTYSNRTSRSILLIN